MKSWGIIGVIGLVGFAFAQHDMHIMTTTAMPDSLPVYTET